MSFKDLRQNLLTEKLDNAQQISALVRKGLMSPSELPKLKMALIRQQQVGDVGRLSRDHRAVLQKYNAALQGAVYGSTSSLQATARNLQKEDIVLEAATVPHDPPMMLILKRKGIRIFPDGKKVALYTNDQLGLTFTIPYVGGEQIEPTVSTGMGMSEEVDMLEENIKRLRFASAKNGKPVSINFKTGDNIKVDPITAKAITSLHSKLSPENKITLMDKISNDPESFKKVASFAHRNLTYKEEPKK